MGDAAVASENGIDVTSMMQRLEALQVERERLDARVEELEREDNALIERGKAIVEEREALERRRIELDGETVEIDARRETLEDEQRALVGTRDALDHEYTELYALLDKAADEPAAPSAVTPVITDRMAIPSVAPLARPAPWRTTLVIVPDGDAPAAAPVVDAAPTPRPSFWRTYRGVIAIATGLVALITAGAIAAWPSDPPPPTVDPKEGLEMVRAAFMPGAPETPASAPVVGEPPAAAPADVAESAPPRAEKRRAKKKPKKKAKTKAKTKAKKNAPAD